MLSESLSRNPLRTRGDLQAAMRELWRPLRPRFERDGAAATLGDNAATYGAPAAMVETFARPLWGVASLVAGGGEFADGELVRRVLADGVDPASPRYWGELGDRDQRAVEMGSLAAALWLAPGLLWEPLPEVARGHLVTWLRQINERELWDSNWRFFRVLVNGALQAVGERSDRARVRGDLERLNSFYRGDGWYADGDTPQFDYYVPMAMQFYALLYAKLAGRDAPLATEFRARARRFAPDFAAWFAPDGSALPLGRSLAYRFAQGAFWGGLAFADEPGLPWGAIKRLHLQHLRWWLRQPIFSEDGLLSVGYGYPNQIMAEAYNAPASPYWAMKAFLPLALSAEHPFWTAEETSPDVPEVQTPAGCEGLVVCRDEARGHVFALSNNLPHPAGHRHTTQKYGKFVYSTAFAFGTPAGGTAPRHGAADNALLVSLDGREWRAREEFAAQPRAGRVLHSRWSPFDGVQIDTWLAPALPGHVRVHRIATTRALRVCEGGFPLAKTPGARAASAGEGGVAAENAEAYSGIWDMAGGRKGELILPEPNTNLLFPLAWLPVLTGTVPAGETWLFTAVAGLRGASQGLAARAWRRELTVQLVGTPGVKRGEETVLTAGPASGGGRVRTVRKPAGRPRWLRLLRKLAGRK